MSSDVSAVTSHFATANEGFNTTTSGNVSSGANTVALNSVTGLVNGSVFVGVIEPGATKEQVFTGIVDSGGSQITGVKWTKGTNVDHATGVSIVDYDTGTGFNMMSQGIQTSLNQDGTLKNGAVYTSAVLANGVVTTAKLADDAVTAAKLDGMDKSLLTTDSNPYKFLVSVGVAYSAGAGSTFVHLDNELFDTNNNFNTTTFRYTVPVDGFYHFDGLVFLTATAGGGTFYGTFLSKNGSAVLIGDGEVNTYPTSFQNRHGVSGLVQLVAGDYIQLNYDDGGSGTVGTGTYLSGYLMCKT